MILLKEKISLGYFTSGNELLNPSETLIVSQINNSNKYVLKPVIGISNEKLKAFARFGIGNNIGSSLEIGIGYSFKERPCGCFPQTR